MICFLPIGYVRELSRDMPPAPLNAREVMRDMPLTSHRLSLKGARADE
jgi:hypothetical protein